MWGGAIASFVVGLLGKLLGGAFGRKAPSAVDLADSNARSQERLDSERAGNEIITKASAARAAADDRRLHGNDGPANAVDADPDSPINRDPDGHYRD